MRYRLCWFAWSIAFDGRFKDADPVVRLASVLLECCHNFYAADSVGRDTAMEIRVHDRLVSGGGVVRVYYVRHFGDEIGPSRLSRTAPSDQTGASFIARSCLTQQHCSSASRCTGGDAGFLIVGQCFEPSRFDTVP